MCNGSALKNFAFIAREIASGKAGFKHTPDKCKLQVPPEQFPNHENGVGENTDPHHLAAPKHEPYADRLQQTAKGATENISGEVPPPAVDRAILRDGRIRSSTPTPKYQRHSWSQKSRKVSVRILRRSILVAEHQNLLQSTTRAVAYIAFNTELSQMTSHRA